MGFGPTDYTPGTPEYVVVVVIDHGGYGAQAAAPAVAQIYNYLYSNPIQPVVLPKCCYSAFHHSTEHHPAGWDPYYHHDDHEAVVHGDEFIHREVNRIQ